MHCDLISCVQVLGDDVGMRGRIAVSWHRLVGSELRPTLRLDAHRQRVAALPAPPATIWQGFELEKAALQRLRARRERRRGSRGAGAAGHGRGRRGRGRAHPAAVALGDGAVSDSEQSCREEEASSSSDGDDSSSSCASEDVDSPEESPPRESDDAVSSSSMSTEALFADVSSDEDADGLAHPEPEGVDAADGVVPELEGDPGILLEMMEVMRPPPDAGGDPVPGDGAEDIVPEVVRVLSEDTDRGRLTYYDKTKTIVASCGLHGARCRLTRTVQGSYLEGREGQGRPLGLLYSWLSAPEGMEQHEHQREFRPDFPARCLARVLLVENGGPNIGRLFELERPRRDGEDEEPAEIP